MRAPTVDCAHHERMRELYQSRANPRCSQELVSSNGNLKASGRLVALRVSEKLTKEDMVSVASPLEEKIRENGKVDLFCDMTGLHG